MTRKIFISYRRSDVRVWGRLIKDSLEDLLEDVEVVLDVSDFAPGADFVDGIHHHIDEATAVLALLGDKWLSELTNPERDKSEDYMRLELELAIRMEKRIFPLLIDGAVMPSMKLLEPPLDMLPRFGATTVTNASFDRDIAYVANELKKFFATVDEFGRPYAGTVETKPKDQGFVVRITENAPKPDPNRANLPPVVPMSQLAPVKQPERHIVDVKYRHAAPAPPVVFPRSQPALRLRDPKRPDGSPREMPKPDNPIERSLMDGLAHFLDARTPEKADMTIIGDLGGFFIQLRREPGMVRIEPVVPFTMPERADAARKVMLDDWRGQGAEEGLAAYYLDDDLKMLAGVIVALFKATDQKLTQLPRMRIDYIAPEEKPAEPQPVAARADADDASPQTQPLDPEIDKVLRKAFAQLTAPATANATILKIEERTSTRYVVFTRTDRITMTVTLDWLGQTQKEEASAFMGKTWVKRGPRVWYPSLTHFVEFGLDEIDALVAATATVFERVLDTPLKRPPKTGFGSVDFDKHPLR